MLDRDRRVSDTASVKSDRVENPMRRIVLGALGSGVVLAGCSGRGLAQEPPPPSAAKEVFNAADRMQSFTNGELDSGEPWVADQRGNFDLTDPLQARLAKLKMTNNLVGERTYIPMFVRLMIARENEPGGVLLGAAGMFTWQLQVPDPAEYPNVPPGTALLRSHFNSTYLDPNTMEPVETLWNPFKKVEMKLQDLLFAENFLNYPLGGSLFVEEPQFANDSPDKPMIPQFQDFGDDLILFQGGTYSEPGPHQPRFTENMWVSNKADVMDPAKSLIDLRYSFTGANKAWEKTWAGYNMNDQDLLIDLAVGKKVHSLDDLPRVHREFIAGKYPERM
ncbi:MAG: hypothetical protein AAF251_10690 [Pseudomonadota bacterium]